MVYKRGRVSRCVQAMICEWSVDKSYEYKLAMSMGICGLFVGMCFNAKWSSTEWGWCAVLWCVGWSINRDFRLPRTWKRTGCSLKLSKSFAK
jgi:hypothetical protein